MSFLPSISGIRTHRLTRQDFLLMRTANLSKSGRCPITYPPGVPTAGLPASREDLLYLPGKSSATMGECERC